MRGGWLAVVRLFRWRSAERDSAEGLRLHVDRETAAYGRGGCAAPGARRRA
jgi:hypothetical protein